MKKFTIALLGVIFVTLIAGSIQSISADHLEPGQGIFKEESEVELVTTHGSNYQIYLQTVFRNGDDQLINVSETTEIGMYIPHKITDHVFDTLMGKKEIITIDNIKYEKVQFIVKDRQYQAPITAQFFIPAIFEISHGSETVTVESFLFQAFVPLVYLEDDDVVDIQWTIFRKLN